MTTTLDRFMSEYKEVINAELVSAIEKLDAPANLKESMAYSLQAGGKRIRPLFLFAVLKAFGKEPSLGVPTAVALEMIHTYSLIHDDLPSMDDDDLRRGKPTNHKVFGEAVAILAGDGLLTYSFQLIAEDMNLSPAQKVELIRLLAACAGPEGMVGGQVADMEGEEKELDISQLEYIHTHKTGKLLAFSVLAGAIISGASTEQTSHLEKFAHHMGLSFQISDDILDVTGDEEEMGKRAGSDTGLQKSTYPSLLTLEVAKEKLRHHLNEAREALEQTQADTAILEDITAFIGSRTY